MSGPFFGSITRNHTHNHVITKYNNTSNTNNIHNDDYDNVPKIKNKRNNTIRSNISKGNTNKRRGKYFEDVIVKDYRKIFKLDKFQCYRAGSSGARTTIEYNGDVSFAEPDKYALITECKYYKTCDLDHFFPTCSAYIDKWLLQLDKEKNHYIEQFGLKIRDDMDGPLCILIVGKPYHKDHYLIIENEDLYPIIENTFTSIIRFYSSKMRRHYIMISYYNLEVLFQIAHLIEKERKE